jgi:sec-independent protein translocase protein TatB
MLGDIGFSEILLIAIVALIVVGPERLPGLARKAGKLVGRGRRFVQSVRDDINQEIAADELKKIIDEQKQSAGIHEIIEETKEAVDEARDQFESGYVLDSIDDEPGEKKTVEPDKAIEKQPKKQTDEPDKS